MENKAFLVLPDGKRIELPDEGMVINTETIEDCALLHVDKTCDFDKGHSFNVKIRARVKSTREIVRSLLGTKNIRTNKALNDGIRLLKMWQKEKEPHRKKYYWHISELKLSRALGNEQVLSFQIGGVDYNLHRDQSGKARIGLGKQPLPSPDDFGKAIPFSNK